MGERRQTSGLREVLWNSERITIREHWPFADDQPQSSPYLCCWRGINNSAVQSFPDLAVKGETQLKHISPISDAHQHNVRSSNCSMWVEF